MFFQSLLMKLRLHVSKMLSIHVIVCREISKLLLCQDAGFYCFLSGFILKPWASVSLLAFVCFPFVTSPVPFLPFSPHLFLITSLVCLYIVFVIPLVFVSLFCIVLSVVPGHSVCLSSPMLPMGIEYFHKSCVRIETRARKSNIHTRKSNIRAHKSNIRAHKSNIHKRIFFPRALFHAMASYFLSCISAPWSNIVACEEKNSLSESARNTFPCSRTQTARSRKSPLLARENFHSARAQVIFF